MTVVVGVDGAGRTHRLRQLADAAGGPVIELRPPLATPEALTRELAAAGTGCLVLVDDAHRLSPEELRLLATWSRQGVAMVIARRPTIGSPELAELEEALTQRGSVEELAALDVPAVAELIAAVTGRPADPEHASSVHAASAGLPAVAAALAEAPDGAPPPSLVARVQRKLAVLGPPTATLARLLALGLEVSDTVLAAACQTDLEQLAVAMRTLRDEGLLVPGSERMVPAVAEAILAELSAAERRRLHDLIARALVGHGAPDDLLIAAAQLRAARARVASAAPVYRAAGDRLRFSDPAAAMAWYDEALEAGADLGDLAAGRAEAAALLGLPIDTAERASDANRLALVRGAVEAHHGRAYRCAEALMAAGAPGPLLAVPSLVAVGRLDEARAVLSASSSAGDAPLALQRLAEAAVAVATEPASAVALFIEAAELVERNPPTVVLPDTPHALGALAAATAGDCASAEHLLTRAFDARVGGPVAVDRHRLLLAWVRMRTGRYDTALLELGRLAGAALPGRERLLLAALAAGVARRSGDIAKLRDAWTTVEPVLARRAVDLFAVEAVEELLVAATRLRREAKVGPALDQLAETVTGLGTPPTWAATVEWIRLQLAVAAENGAAVAEAAQRLAPVAATAGARQRAMGVAAEHWARVFAGDVSDPDAVIAAAQALATEAELPWEGSRLVGQAAIRTTDAGAARRLLEKARELSSVEITVGGERAGQHAGLSEREVEVARMVLAGDTYREIGARLFISPKTVEHHVARIRTKLGATTRAEFLAALREALGDGGRPS